MVTIVAEARIVYKSLPSQCEANNPKKIKRKNVFRVAARKLRFEKFCFFKILVFSGTQVQNPIFNKMDSTHCTDTHTDTHNKAI